MKLISLNTWGGTVVNPLLQFIREKAADTDIFCFQEIFHSDAGGRVIGRSAEANLLTQIQAVLPEHEVIFDSAQDNIEPGGIITDYHLEFGLATFVKKGVVIESTRNEFVFRTKNSCVNCDLRTIGRNIQILEFDISGTKYSVMNFHGLWNGQGKSDTEDRIQQSLKVRSFYEQMPGRRIICGDFNLLPDTQSIRIIGEGMRDLIQEYNITSTRSNLYEKPLKYADYIFVDSDVPVQTFEVFPDEVSDHLALGLDFG